jgi:two-component system chemotaxis sensor kinase CheA
MDIDRNEIVQTFHIESEENCSAMEQALMTLEQQPQNHEVLEELFRAAHTFKGNAACLGFTAPAELAHTLEDYLDGLRAGTNQLTPAIVTQLLESVDVLREMVADTLNGSDVVRPEHAHAIEELRGTLAGGATVDSSASAAQLRNRTLRIDIDKLDRMLNVTGELAIARGRMQQLLASRASFEELLEVHRETDRLYIDLQELVMRARMVSVAPTFRQHIRTVRDLAIAEEKEVRLVLEGEDVELDTKVIEQLRDPLTHMIRNAVDHGIESPVERRAAGKPSRGTITLRAQHDGGSILIEVRDDGCGIRRDRVQARAIELGLLAQGDRPSDTDIDQLIFAPGFTTAAAVSDLSGRGVGMDIVRRNIEALQGTITVGSFPGEGTTISIRLPLTLAIIEGFTVGVGDEKYVVPLGTILECIQLPADATGGACGVMNLRDELLPWVRLRDLFSVDGPRPSRENILVIRHGGGCAGLVVDELHGESQTVVKPVGPLFQGIPGIAGSSVLGNGRVAFIVDVPGLMSAAAERFPTTSVSIRNQTTLEPRVCS